MTDILLGRAYERGRAKQHALRSLIEGANDAAANESHASKSKEWARLAKRLSMYATGEHSIDSPIYNGRHPAIHEAGSPAQVILRQWALQLVTEGKRIDEYIDELLVGAIALPFNLPALPREAETQLTSVLNFRDDLRAYEREVEDFLEEVSMKASAKIDVLPVTQMLNQLQRTYDRAYDVCALKVTTITNTWMAAASLIVAMVAAVVAVVGIFGD